MASQQPASALGTAAEVPAGADNPPPETSSSSESSSAGADHRDENHDAIEALGLASIYSALSSLLGSDKFSDMTIRCGDCAFKAHRAIVCSQSAFFDKALTGGFSEAATSIVDLPEDDPNVMARFLEFLYTGTYDDENHPWRTSVPVSMLSPGEINEELDTLPGVNVAANPDEKDDDTPESSALPAKRGASRSGNADTQGGRAGNDQAEHGTSESESLEYTDDKAPQTGEPEEEYNEFYTESSDEYEDGPVDKKLRQASNEGYHQWFSTCSDMEDLYLPLRLYVMADKYGVPALKLLARNRFYRVAELTWRHAESFPDVVDELYSTTPPTDLAMREIVCRLVGSDIKDDKQRERMDGVMRKHGDFAVGVMNYMIQSSFHIWT